MPEDTCRLWSLPAQPDLQPGYEIQPVDYVVDLSNFRVLFFVFFLDPFAVDLRSPPSPSPLLASPLEPFLLAELLVVFAPAFARPPALPFALPLALPFDSPSFRAASRSAFAFAAASRRSTCFGQFMSMHVIHGRRPEPTTLISGEPHASQVVPSVMISPRGGSEYVTRQSG